MPAFFVDLNNVLASENDAWLRSGNEVLGGLGGSATDKHYGTWVTTSTACGVVEAV